MTLGISGTLGFKPSGGAGGGGGSVSVPVTLVAADPLPSSYRDITWSPPSGKTVTSYRVLVDGVLYGTYASNVTSVRVGDLSPDSAGVITVQADYMETASGSVNWATGPAPALPCS